MSSFSQTFLKTTAAGGPAVHLAAFGKHPGWNDHIDDFGIETESLAQAKQLIYLQGLARQIDSAAWDELPEEKRLPGFNHLVLWTRESSFIAGSLWSSVDGKGRSKYPMVVLVEGIGVPVSWALSTVFPALEALKKECQAAAGADGVLAALTTCRSRLRRLVETAGPGGSANSGPALPAPPALALRRVLYEVSNHMRGYAPGSVDLRADAPLPGRHLRVASSAADAAALAAWSRFLASQLENGIPLLALAARDGGVIDLIAGQPAAADFFCLRASARQLPPTTEIPYTLEPGFLVMADEVLAQLAGGAPPTRTIFGERPKGGFTLFPWASSAREARPANSPGGSAPPAVATDGSPPALKWVKAAFVLLGLAVAGLTVYLATRPR